MSISISELTIEELWGDQTLRIPINEGEIEEDQKVIAHFLLKLLKWHKEQQR